jgi:two-component system, chemotaxis family, sensor kinase CheA
LEDLDEIIAESLVESHENLDQLDSDLVALEQDPTSPQLLGSVFRTIHTIKGMTGFLGFGHLEALTHAGESLLSRLRDGELGLTNMIGGNLKSLLPGPSRLSMPAVTVGAPTAHPAPGAVLVNTVSLACEGLPLTVGIWRT